MNRYNIFNQVHKGLRSCLYETALALQQTDFTNPKTAAIVLEEVSEVIALFEKHADTEDRFLLPALSAYEPSVVAAFEDDHHKDHALAQRLQELIFVLVHSVTHETKAETGRRSILLLWNSWSSTWSIWSKKKACLISCCGDIIPMKS